MKIEIYIDDEKKLFTVPFVPMLARRKYYELQAKIEQKKGNPTTQEMLDEDDEMYSILTNVVFRDQFTNEQLLAGASKKYIDEKLSEAVFGIKPKKETGTEKNNQGE